MSTKIYGGIRFKTSSFAEIIEEGRRLQTVFQDVARKEFVKDAASKCVQLIDHFDYSGIFPFDSETETPWSHSYDKFVSELNEVRIKRYRVPSVDFSASFTMIQRGEEWYGMAHIERNDLQKIFMESDLVEDFSWDNSSNAPEGVKQEDWDNREAVWNEILIDSPADGLPMQAGPVFTIIQEGFIPNIYGIGREEYIAAASSFEERLDKQARDIIAGEFMQPYLDEGKYVFHGFFKAMDYLKTDPGKERLAAQIEELRGVLRPELTAADFFEPLVRYEPPAPLAP